jgi:hypothetical protein
MPIKRFTEQADGSLEEFYQEISSRKAYDRMGVGEAMLRLIEEINRVFKQTDLWGLTSHAQLILLSADDIVSADCVILSSSGFTFYTIAYPLPVAKRPWQNAQVVGEVDTLEQAINYLLIAMRESQGWIGNEELLRLLAERSL